MPSYPASVKSFTSKIAGQNIDPAHVNDIQDEVNAIEAGLLNGTANLNSSNSTLANLVVTGKSTVGQLSGGASTLTSLQVTGNSSFTVRPVLTPPDAALVFLQSTYVAASSGLSTLSFLSEAFVTNSSMHSTAANAERLIPQTTGIYHLTAQIEVPGPTVDYAQVAIRDSSAALIGVTKAQPCTGTFSRIQASGYKRFDVLGGFAVMEYGADAASSRSLSSGVTATWFSMVKL